MNAIVAVDKNMAIGKNNKIPWHITDDFKHFKEVTNNSLVFMGRKTYESIGTSLPNRLNVVLTTNKKLTKYSESDILVHSFDDLSKIINSYQGDVYCIGGGVLYEKYLDSFENIYMTLVNREIEDPDTYFPKFPVGIYTDEMCRDSHYKKGFDLENATSEIELEENNICTYHLFKRSKFDIPENLFDTIDKLGTHDEFSLNFFGEKITISNYSSSLGEKSIELCSTFRPYRDISKDENYIFSIISREDDDERTTVELTDDYDNTDLGKPEVLDNRITKLTVVLDTKNIKFKQMFQNALFGIYRKTKESLNN